MSRPWGRWDSVRDGKQRRKSPTLSAKAGRCRHRPPAPHRWGSAVLGCWRRCPDDAGGRLQWKGEHKAIRREKQGLVLAPQVTEGTKAGRNLHRWAKVSPGLMLQHWRCPSQPAKEQKEGPGSRFYIYIYVRIYSSPIFSRFWTLIFPATAAQRMLLSSTKLDGPSIAGEPDAPDRSPPRTLCLAALSFMPDNAGGDKGSQRAGL